MTNTDETSIAGLKKLTPRENRVFRLVSLGHTQKEIAKRLGVSPKTVSAHVAGVMRKLKIHDRVKLARFAIRVGAVPAVDLEGVQLNSSDGE